jgi:hypothetical protein
MGARHRPKAPAYPPAYEFARMEQGQMPCAAWQEPRVCLLVYLAAPGVRYVGVSRVALVVLLRGC